MYKIIEESNTIEKVIEANINLNNVISYITMIEQDSYMKLQTIKNNNYNP